MDCDSQTGKTTRWLLHEDSEACPYCKLGTTSDKELNAGLPKVTSKIRAKRLRFAGHSLRNCREIASNLVLWSPAHGRRRPGESPLTYPDVLRRAQDMGKAMQDRDYWAAMVVWVAEEDWHPT
ncbi:hypothetical protein Bbelb_017600 [Branchiostoma belcheri]|nr:hypothetical protein Bbelb_017600 [Branchiostoma belcheri]